MARLARVVVPGIPHHVIQRGNRRLPTFYCIHDKLEYIATLAEECERNGVEVWAWCLMPNHTHSVLVPPSEEALARAVGEAHRRYTTGVNERHGWKGHLWQGRFSSYPMDERHTIAAVRYIELNPLRAGLVRRPEDYVWSSARAHLLGRDDGLVRVAPMLARVPDWARFLATPGEAIDFRKHEKTGRPLGDDTFVDALERAVGRALRPRKPGPLAAPKIIAPPPVTFAQWARESRAVGIR